MKKRIAIGVILSVFALCAIGLAVFFVLRNRVTVVFDNRNGDEPTRIVVSRGSKIEKPVDPKKTFYVFDGWAKGTEDGEEWIFETDTVEKDVVLFARWKEETGATFTMDCVFLSGGELTVNMSDKETFDLSEITLNYEGTTAKLFADENCTEEIFSVGATELNDGSNFFYILVKDEKGESKKHAIDLYKPYLVEVSYLGVEGEVVTKKTVYTLDVLPSADYEPTGYTVLGWKGEDGENGKTLGKNAPRELELNAVCKANEYTVTLNFNGGTIDGNDESTELTTEYKKGITLPKPQREGYTFVGWRNGETLKRAEEEFEWTFAEDITFEAEWTYYTVHTDTNIAAAGTYPAIDDKVTVGETVTLTAQTSAGYTWLGWYEDGVKVSEGNSYTYEFVMTEKSRTLIAKWGFSVVISENPQMGDVTEPDGKYFAGDKVVVYATPKNGYEFVGWYRNGVLIAEDKALEITMGDKKEVTIAKFKAKEE